MRMFGSISENRLAEILYSAFHGEVSIVDGDFPPINMYDYEDSVTNEFRKYASMVVEEWNKSEIGSVYRHVSGDDVDDGGEPDTVQIVISVSTGGRISVRTD